jgi:hypothetical protein
MLNAAGHSVACVAGLQLRSIEPSILHANLISLQGKVSFAFHWAVRARLVNATGSTTTGPMINRLVAFWREELPS